MYVCMYVYVRTYVYVCVFETNCPWIAGKVIAHKHTIRLSQHHTFLRAIQRKWACLAVVLRLFDGVTCCDSLLELLAAS